ncbi:tRNA adenosine(34) deaminase TadA [Thalassotalea sp. PS06]|uniref:tRNA adenosine(34) deaminase TadA n=1 Tax=Thalassotalea sp. PS06 TaxID=2594005 RepID=UPI0011623763|nr:tRNA adenosine(34) deaminase TadA [Thalassotalea sp. PS06]QDP00417.1 tRNA adenosine(34) deaminase TadA [Thalassotalea sp. PS06]
MTQETLAQDQAFMRAAMEEAERAAEFGEIPVGAVLVHQGEIIARGCNQSITLNDPSAHAEMQAIRAAGEVLNNYRMLDCTLYVTLEPCPMCAGLLVHSRIKRLVFGASDLKTGSCGSVFNLTQSEKLNHQLEVTSGVLGEECSANLSAFFKKRRDEKKQQKLAKRSQR